MTLFGVLRVVLEIPTVLWEKLAVCCMEDVGNLFIDNTATITAQTWSVMRH